MQAPAAANITLQPTQIVSALLEWMALSRRDLPWRQRRDPYAVWIAEIMLQQTRAATVVPYFERWMLRFPDIESLASASLEQVLKLWEGLGYYARARNLHRAAQRVVAQWGGRLPQDRRNLLALPGIGPYTAGSRSARAAACSIKSPQSSTFRRCRRGDRGRSEQVPHHTARIPGSVGRTLGVSGRHRERRYRTLESIGRGDCRSDRRPRCCATAPHQLPPCVHSLLDYAAPIQMRAGRGDAQGAELSTRGVGLTR
jgi:hypothetical protein